MSTQLTTTAESGFQSTSEIGPHRIEIDPSGEETPDTIESLLAAYAACYVPALRVGAEQRSVDDLGAVTIEVEADRDDDGKLAAVAFDVTVDADLSGEQAEAIVDRANELCKVQAALREDLRADVTLAGQRMSAQ